MLPVGWSAALAGQPLPWQRLARGQLPWTRTLRGVGKSRFIGISLASSYVIGKFGLSMEGVILSTVFIL